MNFENKDELRQALLELHYDLLEQNEANELRTAIASNPVVASEWAATLNLADKFADAAILQGSTPSGAHVAELWQVLSSQAIDQSVVAASVSSRHVESPRLWIAPTVTAVVAASIGLMLLGSWCADQVPTKPTAVVAVQAKFTPSVSSGVNNEYHFVTTRMDGTGAAISGNPVVPAKLSFAVKVANSVLFTGKTQTDEFGAGKIELPPELVIPPQATLSVTARSIKGYDTESSIDVPLEPTRCLTYLTVDRPVYRPGETVYYRSLTLERRSFRPQVDVPIRFELIDPSGTVVPGLANEGVTERGVGNGSFAIPSTAPGGPYTLVAKSLDGFFPEERCKFQVRAYRVPRFKTELEFRKRSYGPGETVEAEFSAERAEGGRLAGVAASITAIVDGEVVCKQSTTTSPEGTCVVSFALPTHISLGVGQLSVVVDDGGTQETKSKTIPIQLGLVDVEFFPEGGYLVEGLENRIYFVARDTLGKPIHLSGEIQSRDGQRVASVETKRDGMGRFDFVPKQGERYSLKVTTPIDVTNTPKLPVAVKELPVIDTGTGVFEAGQPINVVIRTTLSRPVLVRAVCRGQLVGEQSVDLKAGDNSISLPIRDDVGGVVRVTILDPKTIPAMPLVERLVFCRQARRLQVDIVEDDSALKRSPGEPLRLTLQVRDETGEPMPAVLGVAVVDDAALSLDETERPTLRTHFLLTSEVRRPEDLEHANFYLNDTQEATAAVDLLLGTQGWRRFVSGSSSQPNVDFRQQIVRLLELDGNDVASRSQVYENVQNYFQKWAEYRDAVASAWREFEILARMLLAPIFILWVLSVVLRSRGSSRTALAVWLFIGSTSWVIYGCGRSNNNYVVPASKFAEESLAGAVSDSSDRKVAAMSKLSNDADRSAILRIERGAIHDTTSPVVMAAQSIGNALSESSNRSLSQQDLQRLLAARGMDAEALADRLLDELRFPIRQYAHSHVVGDPETREDFAETLYWHPMLITNSDGQASIRFDLSDSVTTFRVSVDAHATDGRIGSLIGGVASRLPFQIEPQLPLEVTIGDRIDLPIAVINATQSETKIELTLNADALLRPIGETARTVKLAAGERRRESISLDVIGGSSEQDASIEIRGAGESLSDSIRRTLHISPAGYPVNQSVAGRLSERAMIPLTIPKDIVPGSLAVNVRAFPSPLADVMSGVESILREPHGCFEQTTATNYPNTMALLYLRESQTANPEVSARAVGMLERGYQKLTSFECQRRGFEWFGKDPGHEALSAFGLLQFTDMAKVLAVSDEMVARTRDWLMGRRDGHGGFERNPRHLHVWSVQQDIVNAYVLWALTEADVASGQPHRAVSELAMELEQLNRVAQQSNDPYLIALSAATLMNVKRTEDGERLLTHLADLQSADGSLQGATTVVSSGGLSLKMETTALSTLAWLKSPRHLAQAQSATNWIYANRSGDGGFGSTQATVLALKALIAIARDQSSQTGGGMLQVKLGGNIIGEAKLPTDSRGASTVEIKGLGKSIDAGRDASEPIELELVAINTKNLSYSVDIAYHALLPNSNEACPLRLSTEIKGQFATDGSVAAGEVMTIAARLVNQTDRGQPMTVAIVGLPGGVEPRIEQLDELKKADRFDYYELRGREVIFYWRTLEPNATKPIDFDVTATIPGKYTGPASRAYLYYTAEQKVWVEPLTIEIKTSTIRESWKRASMPRTKAILFFNQSLNSWTAPG